MRLAISLLLLMRSSSWAFSPSFLGGCRQNPTTSSALFMSTPEEILNRARQASGLPQEEEEEPKLFSNALLEDMRSCLVALEKRAKGGPGSLSATEVSNFEAASQRILEDMKKQAGGLSARPKPGERDFGSNSFESFEEAQARAKELESLENAGTSGRMANMRMMKPPPSAPPQQDQQQPPSQQQQQQQQQQGPEMTLLKTDRTVTDTSDDDEGPAYTGRGGMGQPRGTRNTYVIDGMDEMSPEEYQKALQQSVLAKQQERRKSGLAGNYGTLSYLNHLSGGGDVSPLKTDVLQKNVYAGSAKYDEDNNDTIMG